MSSLGTIIGFAFLGAVGTAMADSHLPGKGVDVPLVKVKDPATNTPAPIHLQAGAVGTVAVGVAAAVTKNPALIGLALGGALIEGVQYTHHYAPALFGPEKTPEQMGEGVKGIPDDVAAPTPPAPEPKAVASFFDALERYRAAA